MYSKSRKMTNKELQKKVVKVAKGYVGMQEIKGNLGWTSKEFEAKMESVGWKSTHAWCAYFTELVWSEVYDSECYAKELDKLFSGSATRTLKNFTNAGWDTGTVPVPGAVAIWCHMKGGKEQWQGHAGIVIKPEDSYMETVEGNTNAAGSREGEVVAEKMRKYNFTATAGLRLKGFVYPPGIKPNVPFRNRAEGNKFRAWVNDYHSEYAREIDLDRSGSWFNSFITKAWKKLGKEYSK
jgi:hypothetical protein